MDWLKYKNQIKALRELESNLSIKETFRALVQLFYATAFVRDKAADLLTKQFGFLVAIDKHLGIEAIERLLAGVYCQAKHLGVDFNRALDQPLIIKEVSSVIK